MLRQYFIPVIALLVFSQCNTVPEQKTNLIAVADAKPMRNYTPKHITPKLTGNWVWNDSWYYTSELIIDSTGTFKYYDQGCTGRSYTEGKWKRKGIYIVLKSFGKFNPDKPVKPVMPESEPVPKEESRDSNTITFNLDSFSIIYSSGTFSMGPGDTTYVYFNNIQLIQDGDTLYRLDADGARTNARYSWDYTN